MTPPKQLPIEIKKETVILRLLADAASLGIISRGTVVASAGELFATQMVEGSDSRLTTGTLYVTLSAMEENGYISSRLEPLAPYSRSVPRRLYKITTKGRQALGPGGIYAMP